ncbi:MAG: phenylacetate--CoA ligase, partial [Deltaproteobacteria bacterium]
MSARDRFLAAVRKHLYPGPEAGLWNAACEAPSRARLREIQQEKLAAAFDYLFEASPFYRRRFEEAGLAPGSIRSLDDLRRVPVTRKLDWIPDIEAHPPWGTFSPLTEERWRDHPWMIFSTSGTT